MTRVVFAYAVILVGIKGQRASERAWGRAAKLPRVVFAGYFGAAGLAFMSMAHLVLFFRDEEWFWLIARLSRERCCCLLRPDGS